MNHYAFELPVIQEFSEIVNFRKNDILELTEESTAQVITVLFIAMSTSHCSVCQLFDSHYSSYAASTNEVIFIILY